MIYVVSLRRLSTWVARRRPAAGPVWDVALAEWVDRVLRRLPPPWRRTCLKRALILQYLLRRAGRAADLHIGVRRGEAGELIAHAWLAQDGKPHLEPDTPRVESFQVLASFPEARSNRS
jgi:hypothetical protein